MPPPTPAALFDNHQSRNIQTLEVICPGPLASALELSETLRRLANEYDSDDTDRLGSFAYGLRSYLNHTLLPYNSARMLYFRDGITHCNIISYPNLDGIKTALIEQLQLLMSNPSNNKRVALDDLILKLHGDVGIVTREALPNATPTLQVPNSVRLSILRNRKHVRTKIWSRLILSAGDWPRSDEPLIKCVYLGGYSNTIVQLKYQNSSSDCCLAKYNTPLVLGDDVQLRVIHDQSANGNTVPNMAYSWEQTRQLYTQNDNDYAQHLDKARIVYLEGLGTTPHVALQINETCLVVANDGKLESMPLEELEIGDRIVLPGREYTLCRNMLTDELLSNNGQTSIRTRTEAWKERLSNALESLPNKHYDFYKHLRSRDNGFGYNPHYMWAWTSDSVMLPQSKTVFALIMRLASDVLGEHCDDTTLNLWWNATKDLISARLKVREVMDEDCARELKRATHPLACPYRVMRGQACAFTVWSIAGLDPNVIEVPHHRIAIVAEGDQR